MAYHPGYQNWQSFSGAGDMVFGGHYQWPDTPPPYKGN
jgi:hypothetical protein